jgi:GNAT superfamily N-acetyltransferase
VSVTTASTSVREAWVVPGATHDRGSASGVVIRPSTRSDVEGLLAFDMTVVVRTRDDWVDAIDKAERGERLLLVAEVDGVIAAFGQAHRLDEHPLDHAPAGWYLTGVTVLPAYRRSGLARRLTAARLAWIADRADEAWYFANEQNAASIRLHHAFEFVEVSRAPSIHGVSFDGGEGVLLRCLSH